VRASTPAPSPNKNIKIVKKKTHRPAGNGFLGLDFLQNYFYKTILMVFLNSPCRETPKTYLKTNKS
jgi:hypothetical protein